MAAVREIQRFVNRHDALIQRVGVKHVDVNVDEMAAGSVHRWRNFFDNLKSTL